MRLVDLLGIQIDPSSGIPVLVLREHDTPHRLLPILIGGPEAAAIGLAMTGQTAPRPLAHDLMATIVEVLDGRVDAAEVSELHDGSFLAQLALTGPAGELRLDTRPSDAIALALRLNAPVYVSEQVLDEAGELPEEELDVEGEVDRFRDFLDDIEPSDFLTDIPETVQPTDPAAGDDES